jgi:hypothetical protein
MAYLRKEVILASRPSAEDIQKANEDLNALTAQCNAGFEELRFARLAALAVIPDARKAMGVHEKAIRAAEAARTAAEVAAAEAREAAFLKAEQDERDANDKADAELRDFDPEPERRTALAGVEDAYNRRLAQIDDAPGTADAKAAGRAKARQEREAAIEKIEAAYRNADATATKKHERAYVTSREKHIQEVQQARQKEQAARDAAVAKFEKGLAEADAALNAAIQAVMTAREIDEDFARRRAELASWCDAEKEAIFARLRAASRTE